MQKTHLGLAQDCSNSSALAMELLQASPKPLIWNSSKHTEAKQNGQHFADGIFKCIFFKENFCILIKILLKIGPDGSIQNNSLLIQIMAWPEQVKSLVTEGV